MARVSLNIVAILAAYLTVQVIHGAEECPNYCDVDEDTRLVCGQSSLTGEIKTFKNLCQMQRSNCKGQEKHHRILLDKCPDEVPICNRLCIGIEDPICTVPTFGGHWHNFTSECKMHTANCAILPGFRKISKGHCPSDCPPCDIDNNVGGSLFGTVCGKYGNGTLHKFTSTCALLLENCRFPSANIIKVSYGECDETRYGLIFN